jgi:hypothetical protein
VPVGGVSLADTGVPGDDGAGVAPTEPPSELPPPPQPERSRPDAKAIAVAALAVLRLADLIVMRSLPRNRMFTFTHTQLCQIPPTER